MIKTAINFKKKKLDFVSFTCMKNIAFYIFFLITDYFHEADSPIRVLEVLLPKPVDVRCHVQSLLAFIDLTVRSLPKFFLILFIYLFIYLF